VCICDIFCRIIVWICCFQLIDTSVVSICTRVEDVLAVYFVMLCVCSVHRARFLHRFSSISIRLWQLQVRTLKWYTLDLIGLSNTSLSTSAQCRGWPFHMEMLGMTSWRSISPLKVSIYHVLYVTVTICSCHVMLWLQLQFDYATTMIRVQKMNMSIFHRSQIKCIW